ncbi:MAG: serine/threonine-protein kinase [Pseudomonadota bacterium]
MSDPTPDPDDDRTVIRPLASAAAAPAAPPRADAPDDGDSSTLPIGTRLGEFELVGVVGVGGFGIVYLAQDHSLQRRVALKEYMPSSLASRRGGHTVVVKSARQRETFEAGLKSFINEARLLAQFDHPSLVKVYRFWEANGTAYMVMPYYQGPTLKDHLLGLGAPPDEAWLRALLAPLTEALEVIHADSCYHRDIAPDNIILLAGSGRPLLLDFGAARRVIGDMTQALTVILKPGYAPLEQYAETPHMRQGPWTDVYALAAVVHFAITGKTPPVSVGRILHDGYVPLASTEGGRYSARFLAAIDHGLQVKPDERTPSIAALRAELGLQAGAAATPLVTTPAPPQPGPTAPAATRARGPMVWALGLAGLALAGVVAYLVLAPAAPPAPTATGAPTAGPSSTAGPVAAPAPAAPASATAAVGSPAPAVVSAPPAGPFSVDAEFSRLLQQQTPGFNVDVQTPKPQLRVGRDQLLFTVTSARDGHVYVLLLGPDGSLLLLLPNSNAPDLRIRAGQPLRLPPPKAKLDVSEPLGKEDFLVLVSPTPRSFDGLDGKRQHGFLVLPATDKLAQLAEAFSGPGSVLAGRALQCAGDLCNAYGAARFSVDVVR